MGPIIFYCSDTRATTYSSLERNGASGTISSMLWLAKGLASKGFSVYIVNEECEKNLGCHEGVFFIGVTELSSISKLILGTPTIVCVGIDFTLRMASLNKILNARIWFWHHNPIIHNEKIRILSAGEIDKHIFVSVNHLIRQIKLNPSLIFSPGKIKVIYNAVDMASDFQDFNLLSNTLPNNKSLKIAYVGNFSAEKGFDKFLSFKERVDPDSTYEWHAFGGGLYNPAEGKDKNDNGIMMHKTLGRRELYEKLSTCDFVASGLGGNETFCVSAVEAALLGKRIITYPKGGQLEALCKYDYIYFITQITNLNELLSSNLKKSKVQEFRFFCHKHYGIRPITERWEKSLRNENIRFPSLVNLRGILKSFNFFGAT